MDLGTPERRNHDAMTLDETMRAGTFRARVQNALRLDVYRAQHDLDEDDPFRNELLAEAGLRLRALYLKSNVEPRLISSYREKLSGKRTSVVSRDAYRGEADKAFRKALEAVPDAYCEIVRHVCIDDLPAYKDGDKNRVSQKEAKIRMQALRVGLGFLLQHFTKRSTLQ